MQTYPPIEDQIVACLRKIMRALELHSRRLIDSIGLTAPQLTVLGAAERLGKISTGALAREVHLSQATVTGIIDRLEQRGLLARSRDGADRRTVNVSVTGTGRTLLGHAPSLLQERFRNELARLETWEQSQVLAILQRVAFMMDAESVIVPPAMTADVPMATDMPVTANEFASEVLHGGPVIAPTDGTSNLK